MVSTTLNEMNPRFSRVGRSLLVLLAYAVISAPAALAQEAGAAADRLPPDVSASLERVLDRARAHELPTHVLVDKALEGVAKGIAADRIERVLQGLAHRLRRANELLTAAGGVTVSADVTAAADALARGVREETLRAIRAEIPAEKPVAVAIHTLSDLLAHGVPVENALDVLRAWSNRNGTPADLRDVPPALERLIRAGTIPSQAAAAIASAMRAGQPPMSIPGPPAGFPPGVPENLPVKPPIPPGAGPPDDAGPPGNGGGAGGRPLNASTR